MNIGRRRFFPLLGAPAGFIAAAARPAAAQPAAADPYPTRPVRLVVPFAPGGPSDALARVFAERLSPALGQPMVVENRSGAGSTVGADAVAKVAKDGHTLLFNNVSHATNAAFHRRLPFDPLADFAPVALLAESPVVLLAARDLPARDLPGLLALLRAAEPGRYAYGSAGTGTASHLAVAQLLAAAGVGMTHVPYRGVGPAMNDLMAGAIALVGDTATTGLGHARGGSVRALAVTSRARLPQAPEISTVAEAGAGTAGLSDYAMTSWNVLLAPAGAPAAAVSRLGEAVRAAKADPAFAARLASLGNTPMPDDPPEAVARFLADEQVRWGRVLAAAGIRPE